MQLGDRTQTPVTAGHHANHSATNQPGAVGQLDVVIVCVERRTFRVIETLY